MGPSSFRDPSGKSPIIIPTLSLVCAPAQQRLMLWSFSMLHWSLCADLRLHNVEMAYTFTIWESSTCCLILAVDSKPVKETRPSGVSLLHCIHMHCLRLKECLSPLSLSLHRWWLTLQHTLQKSPLMHPRGRERRGERKRKKREGFFLFMCPEHTMPVHVSWSTYSIYTNTCTHQHSLRFPAGCKCSWCFCADRVYYAFIRTNSALICSYGTSGLG